MRYKLFILTLIGSYTFGQGGFMFKRPKPELIEKKPPFINEINVDSVSLKINDRYFFNIIKLGRAAASCPLLYALPNLQYPYRAHAL